MTTLLVNCYLRDAEEKMPHYRRLCTGHSYEVREVTARELRPGFDLAGISAVVITGSQWMLAQEPPPAGLVGFCRSLTIPTLGICFGHQLLASSFGATVARGERFLEFDERVELLEDWPLFRGLGGETVMRESHREFVTPESLSLIGWQLGARSDSCPVEAIRHPDLPLYGVQFHPERSGEPGVRLVGNFFTTIAEA
ncbi:gamma-glutamyl-gamma-aminobutyrate hydrolase family protein [candidate division WOR-3 bacterium]|nr:gamma-glutamyl-gamma-aminobutyrate hydrolase family protein [candidate division WOR-3 bacterium]